MSTRSAKLFTASRHVLTRLLRIAVTLAVLAGVGFAVLSARGALEVRAQTRDAPDAAPVTPVTAARIEMLTQYDVARTFSGQVEARQQTGVAFELAGVIKSIAVREGDFVQAGQPIAALDTDLLQAERARLVAQRDAIMAQVELARRTNERQTELLERGFATGQTVDNTSLGLVQLRAEIAALDAGVDIIDINLAKSELIAPFDGYVSARLADVGTVVAGGAPVIELLERGAPRFRVGLDPALAASLEVGQTARVLIAGQTYDVTLAHLSPDLDQASRARIAFFDFDADTPTPAARETGEVTLTASIDGDGAWVPLSALRQGPRGTWTLMVVREGALVVEAAELVHLGSDAAFVRGTFRDGDLFVPGGTHRVVPGQRIDVTEVIAWAL